MNNPAETLCFYCMGCNRAIPALNIDGEKLGECYKLKGKHYCLKCFIKRLFCFWK
jgi:hypothetical protein